LGQIVLLALVAFVVSVVVAIVVTIIVIMTIIITIVIVCLVGVVIIINLARSIVERFYLRRFLLVANLFRLTCSYPQCVYTSDLTV
jgi:hypothetical protein